FTLGQSLGGSGGLSKDGAGTLQLNGASSYSGGTSLNAGSLILGNDSAIGSGALNVTANSNLGAAGDRTLANALVLNTGTSLNLTGDDFTLNGLISGAGALNRSGSGDLTLNHANTYAGGTTIGGGTLTLGSNTALGTGGLTIAGASNLDSASARTLANAITLGDDLTLPGSANFTLNGIITGGTGNSLIKQGTNTLTLNGVNTYAGGTSLDAGTLLLGNDSALGTGALDVTGAANLGSSNGARSLNNAIDLADDLSLIGAADFTLNGIVSGAGALIRAGSGNLTLNAANTYQGGTVLAGGSLTLGNNGTLGSGGLTVNGASSLDSSTGKTLNNAITLNADLTLPGSADLVLDGVISGAAGNSLIKRGASTLTLNGANTHSGGVELHAGSLLLGNDGALGSGNLQVSGNASLRSTAPIRTLQNAIDLDTGTTLALLNGSGNSLTLDGVIDGAGGLSKSGTGTLILNGANGFDGGLRVVDGGTLQLGHDNALGDGILTIGGATVLQSDAARTLANLMQLNSALTLPGAFDLTLNGNLGGSGSLIKNGSADLTLNGNNGYSGGTSLAGGNLILGSNSALGSGALSVTGNAILRDGGLSSLGNAIGLGNGVVLGVDTADTLVLNGVIGGSGSLDKSGAGVLALNGANTYGNGTRLQAGGLLLGHDTALGSGALTVDGAATLDSLTARNLGNAIVLNDDLTLPSSADLSLAGTISGGAGNGLIKQGNGSLTLTGTNTYAGGTTLGGGSLLLGNDAALGSGALSVTAASRLDGTGSSLQLGNAINLGSDLTLPGSVALTLDGLVDGSGRLIKQGASSLTLNSANTYQGGTVLAGGSVLLGDDQALGDGSISVTGNTSLGSTTPGTRSLDNVIDLAASQTLNLLTASGDDIALSGVIGGAGNLSKSGAGTLQLTGNNSYSGDTRITGGTLQLGHDHALGSSSLLILGASSLTGSSPLTLANNIYLGDDLTLASAQNLTLDGTIGGSGVLIKDGAGTLTLNGDNNNFNGLQINAGNLAISTNTALGTGTLDVNANATLTSNGDLSLNNAMDLAGGSQLTLTSADDLTLNGVIGGLGGLRKSGAGSLTLNSANTYSGGTSLSSGLLVLGDDLALGSGALTVSGNGSIDASAVRNLANDIHFTNALSLTVEGSNNLTLSGDLDGSGRLIKNGSGDLTLSGVNDYDAGTQVNAGTLYGNYLSLNGDINVAGGARVEFSQNNDGSYTDVLSGAGTVAKSGSGALTLVDANSFTGLLDVMAGTLLTSGDGVISSASQVDVDGGATLGIGGSETLRNLSGSGTIDLLTAGTSVLNLGALNGTSTFAGSINGLGELNKVNASTLILSGSSNLSGPTDIQAGTLQVDGTLHSASVAVRNGATLAGLGHLSGSVTVDDGGTLAADQTRGTLSLGNLVLNNASQLDFTLGAPNGAALVDVADDLTLDGVLDITDAGNMGLGVYNLFTYGGQLTNNGLTFGALPPILQNNSYALQTGFANQVNLLVENSTGQVQFWNGSVLSPVPGQGIVGGNGTWDSSATNWTNLNGDLSTDWTPGAFAVFGGAAGTVTVEGPQQIIGLQFLNDYVLESGTQPGSGLVANNGAGGTTDIRVNSGVTATIDADISGAGRLNKMDGGTLILSGDNSYTGGTRFAGGVVVIDSDARLGEASGALAFDGGTLRVTGVGGTATSNRAITLESAGGSLDIQDAGRNIVLSQSVSGSGDFTKLGNGTLTLNGNNSYAGSTHLNAGALVLGHAEGISSGTLYVLGGTLDNSIDLGLAATAGTGLDNAIVLNGGLIIGGSNDLALTGVISGSGRLIKNGSEVLEITNTNSYSGGTDLNAGTLVVNSNTALGSGTLRTATGTHLDSSHDVALGNAVVVSGNLTVDGSNNLTLNGTLTGNGSLTKDGAASLTLNRGNAYNGGTVLEDGNVIVGANGALGSGPLTVNGGALDSSTGVTLGNAVGLNSDLQVLGSHDLTLAGVISGNAGVIKDGAATLTLRGNNSYNGDTELNAGTLVVGSNTALGQGELNAAGGTRLDSSTAVSLGNAVNLGGPLTVIGSHALVLNGVVDGSGGLIKHGDANLSLNNANTYAGGTTLADGTLTVGNAGALGSGDLSVTGESTLSSNTPGLVLNNDTHLLAELTVNAGANNLGLAGDIDGAGSLVKSGSGTLTLSGTNSYSGGTTVNGGTLAGDSDSLQGDISTAIGTLIDFIQNQAGTYSGDLSGAGSLIKHGSGNLTLTGVNSYTGGTTVSGGTLTGNTGSLQGNIQLNNGSNLVFDQLIDGTYGGSLSGTGNLIKDGLGSLNLTGTSNIAGNTVINNGALVVDGSLSSTDILIGAGGSLGGGGNISGDVTVDNGAHLVAGTYLTPLSFADDLQLSSGSELDFQLGIPNSPITLISVGGNLTLDGTLNIANAGGLGVGIYRLFSYGGQLTNHGLVYGDLPPGYDASDFTLQTAIGGQVNLLLEGTPGEIQFWDGNGTADDNVISGGNGTWDAVATNWTNANGSSNLAWNNRFAAFAGSAGNVTVNGAQNFTGMQFLTDGYHLQSGSAAALTAMADNNGNAPRIIVDSGSKATVDVAIGGSHGLIKTGAGTLVLGGSNTYSGGTTVSGGTLQIAADSALGANGQGLTLDGGVLGISGTTFASTNRAITLGSQGGGFDIQAAGHTFNVNQALSGNASLTKRGAGTLALNGNNSYGGGTLLQGGTLLGDASSLQGNVLSSSGTTLQFEQAGAGTYAGSYSGAGQLVKSGSGNLTLSGNNSYTGGTLVSAGTLTGDTDSLRGDILNNATLAFEQDTNGVFGGILWGNGTVLKSGSGTLLLIDDQHFTGNVQIDAGGLQIGDASGSDNRLAANISVGANGALSGTGSINNLDNRGTVAPGYEGVGTLNVNGAYVGRPTSRLLVNLHTSSISNLSVEETAQLDGALEVRNISYAGGVNRLTLLSADEGISGRFSQTLLPEFAFLDTAIRYDSNDVILDITRNEQGLSSVAFTPNQAAVANAIEQANGGALQNAILSLDANEARHAYDQLSGEIYASNLAAMKTESLMIRQAVEARMRQTCQQCAVTNPMPLMPLALTLDDTPTAQSSAWAYAIGGWGTQDGDDNAAELERSTKGMMFGYDRAFGQNWRAGVTGGYSNSSTSVDSRDSDLSIDAYHLGVYGSYREGPLSLRTGALYSWQDIDSKRNVTFSGFNERLKANYDAQTWQTFGEVGYLLDYEELNVEPYLNLAYTRYQTDTIKEKGGVARLDSKVDQDTTSSILGIRVAKHINLRRETDLVLRGGLGWQHAFDDEIPDADMAFAETGAGFTIQGTPIAQDAAIVEAGVELNIGENSKVQMSYNGQLADEGRNHEMRIEFSHRF
ncbi:autotransporter-associated beta strand repeat-containing protein, partial [Pseudomonas sp. Gutcm_11s]|uniref:autotransporter-associated beta strand repeat-containing protein n=1 Tax=Pseudomonas sp. Gutcm_11s TaxID=3026088 RepID=UPI00235E9C9A